MPILINPFAHGGGAASDPDPLRFQETRSSDENQSSYTFSAVSIGIPDEARLVVVAVSARASGGSNPTVSSVTIGETAATQIVSQSNSRSVSAIWAATVTTALQPDITVAFSTTMIHCAIGAWAGLVDSATARDTATATTPNGLADLDVIPDSVVIACMIKEENTADTTVAWNGVDTATLRDQAAIQTSAFAFADVVSTETSSVRDLAFTTSPAFPSVSSSRTGTSAEGTSHNVTMPSGVTAGERLMIFSSFHLATTTTPPSGWTRLSPSSSLRLHVFYKTADGTESTVTVTTGSSVVGAHHAYRVDKHEDNPEGGSVASGTGNEPNPPSVTPSWGEQRNLFLVAGMAADTEGSPLWTYPTNYTNGINNTRVQPDGLGLRLASARRQLKATSEDPGVFSHPGSGLPIAATTVAIQGKFIGALAAAVWDRPAA